MATHFSILAWKIPWTEEPGRLQSMWLQESDRTGQLTKHLNTYLKVPLKHSERRKILLDTLDQRGI